MGGGTLLSRPCPRIAVALKTPRRPPRGCGAVLLRVRRGPGRAGGETSKGAFHACQGPLPLLAHMHAHAHVPASIINSQQTPVACCAILKVQFDLRETCKHTGLGIGGALLCP